MIDPAAPVTTHDDYLPLLVGREREQALLGEALAVALSGHGRLALLAGEAGIGKTALARDLAREARAGGAAVLLGRAYDLSEPPPYGVWLDLLGPAALGRSPDPLDALREALRPVAGATGGQAALFDRAFAAFAHLAGQRTLVLVLDDLHWADPASLDLLRFVARQLAALPLLLVGTYRADELADGHPLARLLPALVREAEPLRLAIAPLEGVAVQQLVRVGYALSAGEEDRLIGYLQAHAAGNPLYLGELLRTLEEERVLRPDTEARWALGDLARMRVPPLLRQVIAERVGRLGVEANSRLAVAAVLGQEVPLDLWAVIAGVPEEEGLELVERASAARVLEATPDGLRAQFYHPLIRQALYEGLLAPRRRAVHQRAGDLLAALPQPDPDAVADHFQRASDPRAAEWLVRAGLRARRADAWFMAAERFATAATLLATAESHARERGWLRFYAAFLLRFSDNLRALEHLDAADRAAKVAGDLVLAAYARYQRGPLFCMRGEIRRGLADMAQGVAGLDALPAEYHLRVSEELALAAIVALAPEEDPSLPARQLQASAPPTTTPQRGVLVHWLGQAGRYREALATGERFIAAMTSALGEGRLQMYPCLTGHLGLGHAYAALGRPADARHQFVLARGAFDALGEAYMVEFTLWTELLLVLLPYRADDIAGRARLVAEAARAWDHAEGRITTAMHASQAELLVALLDGRWVVAHDLAQAGLAATTVPQRRGALLCLGILARHRGAPADAWAQVRAFFPAGPDTEPGDDYFPAACMALALAGELALDAGDLAEAARWLAAHARWLDWSGAILWQADHLRLRARHAWLSGDLAGARAHAEAALTRATEPRQPLAMLAANRLLGGLATADGRYVAAAAHLDTALALAEACGAPYERALTLLALAELRAAEGRSGEFATALMEASALLVPLGARPALARADAIAAHLVAPSPPVAPAPPLFGLTAREAEVLRLLAEGLTDAQIAERLFVSRHTINAHLRGIYGKLGVKTRAAAARRATDHGLA